MKSKQELIKYTLSFFSYKITKKGLETRIIVLTPQSTFRIVSTALHLEKLRHGKKQRTTSTPLASSPAVWLEPPAHNPSPRKDLGAVCFPATQQRDTRVAAQLPAGTQTWDAYVDIILTLRRIKPIPGFRKSHRSQQTAPSDTANAKLPLSSILEETCLGAITTPILGMAQRSLSFYKVYSAASAHVEEQGESLKMLMAATMQPPPRTWALLAHSRRKRGAGGQPAREHISARPPFLCLAIATEPQAVSKSGAGR